MVISDRLVGPKSRSRALQHNALRAWLTADVRPNQHAMSYTDDANGDVFRRMEGSGFDFTKEHVVDFHAVFATEEEADQIARLYLADHKAGDKLANVETKPHDAGGMELLLSKRMIVTYQAVTDFEMLLSRRVATVEGYLDGWGVLQD